jgi:stage V sporulation protein R
MTQQPLFDGAEWNFELLEKSLEVVEQIGQHELGMTLYPNQIEIISSDQMLDNYSSVGLPVMYPHWSFGKSLIRNQQMYKKGQMGLAYEIVINTCPSIAYLMEDNSMTMQLLVLAHASVGHNFCFANNYMFRQWTDADSIVDYLVFARKYISICEEKYGVSEVEQVLDSCHALQSLGVDKYKRRGKLNAKQEQAKLESRLHDWDRNQTEFWYSMDPSSRDKRPHEPKLLEEPEENLLYFIEKNSPILKPWQRELVRIVRKIAQYFYPQRQCKLLHEGVATFTHWWILNHMWDQGLITHGSQLEWLASHSNVIFQPSFDSKHYSGINPYALGFAIFRDIKRIATEPTAEDRAWFPKLAGSDWKSAVRDAATNYRDDAFVSQFLSPRVARDLKLFGIVDNSDSSEVVVNAIHNDYTFATLRQQLANQYDISQWDPNIMVVGADLEGDRSLQLQHYIVNGRSLDKDTPILLEHIKRLWGFAVTLQSTQNGLITNTWTTK